MKRILKLIAKFWIVIASTAFTVQILVALIGIPSCFQRWITAQDVAIAEVPHYVVVLGGGGIPSETGLIRTYYAAEYGRGATGATFIVALPSDGDPGCTSVGRMRDELIMRGVRADSILMEFRGRNTYEQACNIAEMLGSAAHEAPTLIVTSPSHARRAVLCFRKAGFRKLGCQIADNTGAEADMGRWTFERYGFWSILTREIEYLRELVAMAYYKLRRWI